MPRLPKNSLPTREPWQPVHWLTGSGRLRKAWPAMRPPSAAAGRLTWQPPQPVWHEPQCCSRVVSTACRAEGDDRSRSRAVKTGAKACREAPADSASSGWHRPHASLASTLGRGIIPAWAASLSPVRSLPEWQAAHPNLPCSVFRNSPETSTLSSGSNGASSPPQPGPSIRAETLFS